MTWRWPSTACCAAGRCRPRCAAWTSSGEVRVDVTAPPPPPPSARSGETGYRRQAALPSVSSVPESELPVLAHAAAHARTPLQPVRIYAYGVARNRLRQPPAGCVCRPRSSTSPARRT